MGSLWSWPGRAETASAGWPPRTNGGRSAGDDRVGVAVRLQQRAVIAADLGGRIQPRPHRPTDRQPGEMVGGHVGQAVEGALQHQGPGAVAGGQVDGHRPADRLAHQHHVALGDLLAGGQPAAGRRGRRPECPPRSACPRSGRNRDSRRSAPIRRRGGAASRECMPDG